MQKIFYGSLLSFFLLLFQKGNGQNLPVNDTHSDYIISRVFVRNVGFGADGIRFSALAVYDKDPRIFYLASGNGGVMKTTDGGYNFQFVFDRYGSSHIGAVTVSQNNPDLVWVGTGEGWQRNSVGGGDGIYKSTDGGANWQHMGLKDCNSFSKIVLHPVNDDIVFAAGLGSAWGYGPDRGIFKTTNGGKTWKKVLYQDEKSAGTEVIIDPINPNNMLAALWDHVHKPYGIYGSGPGSGIWRSTDGGETWTRITFGLPKVNMGRIAMDYFPKDPNHVAAVIEEPEPGSGVYTSEDGGITWQEKKGIHPVRPMDSSVIAGTGNNRRHFGRPFYNHVVKYHPENRHHFFYGDVLHYTTDGGDNWVGGMGDYHGLWINPNNTKHFITIHDRAARQGWNLGLPRDFRSEMRIDMYTLPVDQVYGIGYDMRRLYRVMGNCQDGNLSSTITQGISGYVTEDQSLNLGGEEGGNSMADPKDWARVYTGDRGLSMGRVNLRTGERVWSILEKSKIPDDAYASNNAYEQYKTKKYPLRANYTRPFIISRFDHKTLYLGANRLLRSKDKGETWEIISPDLTHDRKDWQVPSQTVYPNVDNPVSWNYQCISSISESPLNKNLIWCATDDGYVQLTRDGGKSWNNMSANIPGVPEYCWVSCVEASRYKEGRAYITFDNHKNNDLKTYVYVTEDYGRTWSEITATLPQKEPCYVIREGRKNPDLLYLGTEYSLWISLDRGQSWNRYSQWNIINSQWNIENEGLPSIGYFPTVRVSDLHIHPRELDLIIGTHGRGAWILHARALEEMTTANRNREVYFATPGKIYLFPTYSKMYNYRGIDQIPKLQRFAENTQPGVLFSYHLKKEIRGQVTIHIVDRNNQPLLDEAKQKVIINGSKKQGLNTIKWMSAGIISRPGIYKAILKINSRSYEQVLVAEDASNEIGGGANYDYPK